MTLVVASLVLASAAVQEPPTFSARADTVSVDVSVLRKNAPVAGLTAADFELKDDGVLQKITLANLERLPLSVVLVFDASGSVASKLSKLRAAGHALLDGLRAGDEASVVAFSQRVELLVAPTRDLVSAGRALDRIEAAGSTSAYDALYAGLLLPSAGFRSVVVIFTDGDDNMSFLTADQVQEAAERERVLVHVVAIRTGDRHVTGGLPGQLSPITGPSPDETNGVRVLRLAAESTGGRFWWADSSAHLKETFEKVLAEMKTRYVLQYDPSGVAREGTHRLEVRVKRHGVDVLARRSYWVPPRVAAH